MLRGVKRWVRKKLVIRQLESWKRKLDESEGAGMRIPKSVQLGIAAVVAAVVTGGADAALQYMQVDPSFAWSELLKAMASGALGALLLWLRSPKDKRIGNEERREGEKLLRSSMKYPEGRGR